MTSTDQALSKEPTPSSTRGGAADTGREPAESTLAADIGGTHMRVAVIDDNGQVLVREMLATPITARFPPP
jgi:hypothetical protein